jgi:amino acid permease
MKAYIKWSYLFAVIAVVSCVISSVLYFFKHETAEAIGCISTIISIALSIISMINSCVTEKKTSETLNDIINQNTKLVEMINHQLSKDNYDKRNLESLYSDKSFD